MPRRPTHASYAGRVGKSGNQEDKHYFGHDDRVRSDGGSYLGNRPRVSFKTQARPSRDSHKSLLFSKLDEDVLMATGSNNNNRQVVIRGRNRGVPRGRNSPVPHRHFRAGVFDAGIKQLGLLRPSNWYKVVIPHGQKYEKDYILSNLLSYISPQTFVPIMYEVNGNDATFYIDDMKAATKLLKSSRQVTLTDGFKLQVKVTTPDFPQRKIDDKFKERLKQVMAKRYVQETNALDLTCFHHDPDLVSDYFCGLFRPVLLKTVLEFILEHIPTLEALNLDRNKLHNIEKLEILNKFTKLKILYIGDNQIRRITQIDVIKGLRLEEFRLAGNPVCDYYKSERNDYISDMRKRFPKLLRLDGVELPKPILFDVLDEGTKLPPAQRMFAINAKAQEIASQFLQQYFLIFDSDNRQPLLDAYDDHANFSMTICQQSISKLNDHFTQNRNLFVVNDSTRRQKYLKHGRLPVVSFISEMPATTHYLNTFTMDINLITDGMMLITVTGLFKERASKNQSIVHFNRTFIIVPEGRGYCICNEQLHIRHPTDELKATVGNQSSEAQMSDTASGSRTSTGAVVKPIVAHVPEDVKQQMTLALIQQTNMNLEWSLKCLEEVQWNYDNALAAFKEFFERGQIPQEAFNK